MARWTPDNPDKFCRSIVDMFEIESGMYHGFELWQRLWHAMVAVGEVTSEHDDWYGQLAKIGVAAGLKQSEVLTTWRSAERRVSGAA
jgi:hypothetical protein